MKSIILFVLATLVFCSCNEDTKFSNDQYPQKWELTKMIGGIPNSETVGANMEMQETYLLNSDGTFSKSRERNDKLTEATGTFTFKDLSDGKYLELVYEFNNDIIGSCTSELKEVLKLETDTKLMGTWLACDGPGLEYSRIF